jgi:hypothetical protein
MIYTIITLCKQTFPWVHFRFLFSSLRKDMIHIASTQQDGQVAFVWQEFSSKPALTFWANFSFPPSFPYFIILVLFLFSHVTRSILLYHIQHAALLLVGLQDHPSCPNNRERKNRTEKELRSCVWRRVYTSWQRPGSCEKAGTHLSYLPGMQLARKVPWSYQTFLKKHFRFLHTP